NDLCMRCSVAACIGGCPGSFYRAATINDIVGFTIERHCYFTVTVISSCHCWYSWYRYAINACIRRCIREHWIFSIGYFNDLCMSCSVAACIGGCPGSFYRAATINDIVGFTIERHCYFTVTVISSCHCWYSWYRSAINACIRRCIREHWIFSIGYCYDLCMRCSVERGRAQCGSALFDVVGVQTCALALVLSIVPQPSTTLLVSPSNVTVTSLSQLSVAVTVGTAGIAPQSTLASAGAFVNTGSSVSVTVMICVCVAVL